MNTYQWFSLRSKLPSAIGPRAAITHALYRRLGKWTPVYCIHPRGVIHPLWVRGNSSDVEVFRQIFIRREYHSLGDTGDVRLVVDCGANVGYASAYFLSAYPHCGLIAIAPDPENFAMLERNTAAYGTRVKLMRAAVWSHPAQMTMSADRFRDGREWSKQVRLCKPGEKADVDALTIGSVLDSSGHDRISILKIDVEGAESVIFADNYESWLDKVDTIVIELHDDSVFGNASDIFYRAIGGRGFGVSHCGELTVCRKVDRHGEAQRDGQSQ
jgi:FkbM family methyltransferase